MVSLQPNIQSHDELAALFSRNLTFNPDYGKVAPPADPAPPAPAVQPLAYSVSQHYHHSSHLMNHQGRSEDVAAQEAQGFSSEPAQIASQTSETILRIHGIDPASLTPAQVNLFRVADSPQQMRLLELWSICPPNTGGDIPALAWSSTTLDHEEYLARFRFERAQKAQAMSLDGTPVQVNDGRWHQQGRWESEPYMSSGYQELMRREEERERQKEESRLMDQKQGGSHAGPQNYTHATDPVYMGPDQARQQQQVDMASQYGSFEQTRSYGELEAMDVL